jgi:hypothetical protein
MTVIETKKEIKNNLGKIVICEVLQDKLFDERISRYRFFDVVFCNVSSSPKERRKPTMFIS